MLKILLFLVLSISFYSISFSQEINGKVVDASNSEPLIGAIVKAVEDKSGAETDLDGTYNIKLSKPGTYTIEFTYVGYKTYSVKDVVIKQGEVVNLNASLSGEGISTEEIVIEATISMANENALLQEQKNSNKISDGISEQQIKRAPDASASDVLKRVIGVTIVGDKFVNVRGTNERYNNTTLNGVILPSTDPDKKAFSFDLFPSNLLENIIIAKSFTSDLPGNFSGGLVQLTTKEFPEALTVNFSTTGSVLTNSSFTDNFLSYNAGQSKILFFNSGWDDGGRSLPSQIPNTPVTGSNDYGQYFRNNWAQTTSRAPMNGGYQLSVGNQFTVANNPLGVILAYSYKNSFETKDEVRNEYIGDTTRFIHFNGQKSKYSVSNGGLANFSYKLGDFNKISFKNTYSLSSDDETEYSEGFRILSFSSGDEDRKNYKTSFVERRLFSSQLTGSHYVNNFNNLNITWRGSYSESKRNEPDVKTAYYRKEYNSEDPYIIPITTIPNSNVGRRFFSTLFDINRTAGVDFDMNFIKLKNFSQSKVKAGVFASGTSRNFTARSFEPYRSGSFFNGTQSIENVFNPQNFADSTLTMREVTNNADRYNAEENLYAGYLSFEIPLNKFRFIGGVRYENSDQRLEGFDRTSLTPLPINVSLKTNDILPGINLTYAVSDKINLRLSASQTVSRPELRELAPFGYTDYLTDGDISGNPDLKSSLIQNYDLRFEMFPNAGEVFSISAFYKHFNSPIERVIVPTITTPAPAYTFENAEDGAINFGVELEARKNLGFISRKLSNFLINGNIAFINSEVDLEGTSSGGNEKKRRLQGQAPFTINLGLFYDNADLGTSLNLLYNRNGDRISEVGRRGFNDVFEKGRDLVDFTATQKLFKGFEFKLGIKDILNQDDRFTQMVTINQTSSEEVEKDVRVIKSGTTYSFTIGYKF
jgi:hypothetical protein